MSHPNQFNALTQLRLSPFFERTSKLNESQEWRRWSGYLSATNYELTHDNEYFAIRTKAALLDISPLHKYIIQGPDSQIFLDRLVTTALPRVRDFQGVKVSGFDGRGNYNLGVTEQIIFPEINIDKVNKISGMDITFVTSAKTDKEAKSLLSELGLPFKKN